MPNAWSFGRVSTIDQAATGGGLRRQVDDGRALLWCQRNGYQLVDAFSHAGSAFKGRHLAEGAPLRQWLELAVAGDLGPAPALLVEEVDRFTRQAAHLALGELLNSVFPAGVVVVNLREGVVYSQAEFERDDRRLPDLLDDIRAAHRFSRRLSRRITSYWDQVREAVEAGHVVRPHAIAPFWVVASADQRRWELGALAPLARRIFDRALHVGAVTIARELNDDGVPCLTNRKASGRPWTSGGLCHHLRNRAAYGAMVMQGGALVRDDYFPPLISREQWEAVQRATATRRHDTSTRGRRGTVWWVGQGLTRCECGAGVQATRAGGGGVPKRYLRCARRRDQPGVCDAAPYRLDVVTAHLLTRLQPEQLAHLLGLAGDRQKAIRQAIATRDQAMAADAQAQAELGNAVQALKGAIKAGVSVDVFVAAHQEAGARARGTADQLAGATAALSELQQRGHAGVPEAAATMLQQFAKGADTADQRRGLNDGLRRLGLRITMAADQRAMGLQVGDGPVDWQPVAAPQLDLLAQGRSGVRSVARGDELAMVDGEDVTLYLPANPTQQG